LLAFLNSKRDYIWFAFFFILAQGPGYFFVETSMESQYRLPFYTVGPFSFYVTDLFVILALAKSILKGKRIHLKSQGPLCVALAYISLSVATSFVFGTSTRLLASNLRWVFYYSVIISFMYLNDQRDYIRRFMFLIFPIVFFILFTQIYCLTAQSELIQHFNPDFRNILFDEFGEIRPIMGGELLVFGSLIFSLCLLDKTNSRATRGYLYVVIIVSFISVFISATRVWFIIFSFTLGSYIVMSRKKVFSVIGVTFFCFLSLFILSYFGVVEWEFASGASWKRLGGVFDVVRGDILRVESARDRVFKDVPRIAEVIMDSPLIGYGFSEVSATNYINDLGFFNTILMFGIFGFMILNGLFYKLFKEIKSALNWIGKDNPARIPVLVMGISWCGILIGYFSTWDFFSCYFGRIFFVGVVIAMTEIFVREAENEVRFKRER
jgi:hypothetical protein